VVGRTSGEVLAVKSGVQAWDITSAASSRLCRQEVTEQELDTLVSLKTARRSLRTDLENLVCRSRPGYRAFLRVSHRARTPRGRPVVDWQNSTLKTRSQWELARAQVRNLGLMEHADGCKNWDALAALATILDHTTPASAVLDAGAEWYSPILPSLFLYGYENLVGINLEFRKSARRGPIRYEPGDLTHSRFDDQTFDAISCLSVIEHGVDLNAYFREMHRILKPNGILITSTDYWPVPIDTGTASAYASPVTIFTEKDLRSAVEVAQRCGFDPTGPIDFTAQDKAVSWSRFGLEFTFVTFCLRRRNSAEKPQTGTQN
jgi:SAM-dependent methyltransferase